MSRRRAWLVAGLGFGDEGKGSVVDYLVRTTGARLVVRYNGGCQASHEVVLPDGRRHAFHQFGSGTLAGAHTYLGPEVVVDPILLAREANDLIALGMKAPMGLLSVDPECPVTTPIHRAVNRARETARGDARHGSCGLGVGEVQRGVAEGTGTLRVGGIVYSPEAALDLLDLIRAQAEAAQDDIGVEFGLPSYEELRDWLYDARYALLMTRAGGPLDFGGDVVFEGAQGVLLDQWHGFHPHTSWGDCTFGGAERVLAEMSLWSLQTVRLGVLRAYATRHGAGPLPTYSAGLTRLYGPSRGHNGPNPWQGALRVGHFDAVLARYALSVLAGPGGGAGVDQLAVTCLDEMDCAASWLGCHSYRTGIGGRVVRLWPSKSTGAELLERQARLGRDLSEAEPLYEDVRDGNKAALWIEARLGVPVGLTSHGPTYEDKWMRQEVMA